MRSAKGVWTLMGVEYVLEQDGPRPVAGSSLWRFAVRSLTVIIVVFAGASIVWSGRIGNTSAPVMVLVVSTFLFLYIAAAWAIEGKSGRARVSLVLSLVLAGFCNVLVPTKDKVWLVEGELYATSWAVSLPFVSTVDKIDVRTNSESHDPFNVYVQIDKGSPFYVHVMFDVDLRHVPLTKETAQRMVPGQELANMTPVVTQLLYSGVERCFAVDVPVMPRSLAGELLILKEVRRSLVEQDFDVTGTIRIRDVEMTMLDPTQM